MPVTKEEPAGAGQKRVAFAPTPRMSSYLSVLAAGELERITPMTLRRMRLPSRCLALAAS
jgi:aminopeptidase N